ncbi:MAG TPA: lipoprotein-releasing ABC transporter permease subunit [Caulobacteraceae bacterium]|jgi:lipoprotein-releasing system permease protein|nr:lipoprotein-releasing ABC transporter permease subunit [Caulobacteraceae bacterium]
MTDAPAAAPTLAAARPAAPSFGAAPFSAWERELAFRYLRARRSEGGVALISIISFLGIMLAVAVLIIVMSVMNGFRADLSGMILGFNGHDYVVSPAETPQARAAIIGRLRAMPHVVQAIPVVESQTLAQSASGAAGAIVRGVTPADLKATAIIANNIKAGSLAGFGQGEDGGDVVILGKRLAESLGVQPGEAITLISPASTATALGALPIQKTYIVGGLFEVGMSEYDQAFVYMPLNQAQLFFGRGPSIDYIEVKLDNPELAPDLKPALAQASGPGAVVTDWTQKNQAYFGALMVEHNVMFLILALLVLLASLNIISALVMLVKNKGRDIAILRTMGAGQGAILRVFFLCGATVGALGTAAGLLIGVLFCWNIAGIQHVVEWITGQQVFSAQVYFLSRVPAKIEWHEVVSITLIALAASFLATLPPAFRASRLDPVEALRYE